MASLFAAQLQLIAANTTNELDLKAQKASHAESLIFEKKVAGSQDFETIYQICLEGYQDLCRLDARFHDFERNLFSSQSKNQDRAQMTIEENAALDAVLEVFLGLIGSRLLLRPAIKAVEWLVRRFKVHVYNTSFILLTFLPYHQTPIFQNLLSILPANIPPEFKFLRPYLKTATCPPRHAVAYSATNTDSLFDALNNYTLRICRARYDYELLLSFWTGITTEAVSGRLGLAQSGRKEVQRQRQEDVMLKILPVLNDGFTIRGVPELTLACYTLSIILASKGNLADSVIDSLMDTIANTMSINISRAAVVSLLILGTHRSQWEVPKKTFDKVMRIANLETMLGQLAEQYEIDQFLLALYKASLRRLKKNDHAEKIAFAEKLVRIQIWAESNLLEALAFTMEKVAGLTGDDPVNVSAKARLLDMIRRLNEDENFQTAVGKAASVLGAGFAQVEADLQMLIKAPAPKGTEENVDIDFEYEAKQSAVDASRDLLGRVPQRTVDEHSFLTQTASHVFEPLKDTFLVLCQHHDGIRQLQSLPIWQSASDPAEPLFISFLLRITFGSYPHSARLCAIKMMTISLRSQHTALDGQALLPYITALLADPDNRIRKEATSLLIALEEAMPKDLVDGEESTKWGAQDLYTSGDQSSEVTWIPTQDAVKIIRRGYLPVLEECILDPTQVARALQSALLGSSSNIRVSARTESIDLKKNVRHNFFELLLSHLKATPVYAVKVSLLNILTRVDKVGSTNRTKVLVPMVRQWASMSAEDAQKSAQAAHVELSVLEITMAGVISPTEKDCMQMVLSLLTDNHIPPRPTFVTALINHVIKIWSALSPERQSSSAQTLFEFATKEHDPLGLARHAKDVLRSVSLPTEALVMLLDEVHSSFAKMREHTPSTKRRRTSQNQMIAVAPTDAEGMKSNIVMATFVLELVDSSKPESRPQLLGPLFHLLAALQYLKAQTRSELSYLLALDLGSLLAIVDKAGTFSKTNVDESAIRTELIIDCVRMTESPQVQNVALLLIAALCKIVPGRVLHNIMPIFTFMSTGVMRKDDEHSVHVIDQTIEMVIPPLINSLRAQRRDIVVGTSELLASFVAAFDHIPSHRRLRLFGNLVSKLGAGDFLFAIIAMLASREGDYMTTRSSIGMLMNAFSVDTQLSSLEKYVDLIRDALLGQSSQAQVLLSLNVNEPESNHFKVLSLIRALSHLLNRPGSKAAARAEVNAMRLQSHLSVLLQQILSLAEHAKADEELASAVNDSLVALLDLPSFIEYINIVRDCLGRADNELRRKVLRLLGIRLRKVGNKDKPTQRAAIAFLDPLAELLTGQADVQVKHAALACIDRISDEFGRSDIRSIVATAQVVAGAECLGLGADKSIKIMALLCLASMVEIMQEAVVPIIPNLMPKVFQLLEQSMAEDKEIKEQHNAAFSLLSSILSHVPFMMSETYLDSILELSAKSAYAELGSDCDESRLELLQLLARQLDLRMAIAGLQRKWPIAVENDITAVKENLETLSTAIERHTKSIVVKNADLLSDFLLEAFDLRRVQLSNRTEDSFSDDEVAEIESAVNSLAIKLIYKLNDTVFRPIFSKAVDWAVKCPGIKGDNLARAKTLRQTTLFNFLAHFFGTLKSIVTSYASYILEPAAEFLRQTTLLAKADGYDDTQASSNSTSTDVDTLNLWLSTLTMLRESFTYDADAFFASPSHFDTLAPLLVSQLTLASVVTSKFNPHITSTLIPTVVALAASVLDNPSHLKTLNHHICLLRHSSAAAVRLASVRCQAALTESEELGTDWLESCIRAGEGLVYANEMLEDDDEEVEREVRKWVFRVNEVLGEDVLEA